MKTLQEIKAVADELEQVSFEELMRVFDFERVSKVEKYLFDRHGMQRNHSLRIKLKNIMNFTDQMNDADFDKLNDYVDTLVRPEDLEKIKSQTWYYPDAWKEGAS